MDEPHAGSTRFLDIEAFVEAPRDLSKEAEVGQDYLLN